MDGLNSLGGRSVPVARPTSSQVWPSSEPETTQVHPSGRSLRVSTRASRSTRSISGAVFPPPNSICTQPPGPFQFTTVIGLRSSKYSRSFFLSVPCWLVETATHCGGLISLIPSVTNCAVRL